LRAIWKLRRGQSNARNEKARNEKDRDLCCFTAGHRVYGGVLGVSSVCGCLVGVPALGELRLFASSAGTYLGPAAANLRFAGASYAMPFIRG
jgi:hypothetical protein